MAGTRRRTESWRTRCTQSSCLGNKCASISCMLHRRPGTCCAALWRCPGARQHQRRCCSVRLRLRAGGHAADLLARCFVLRTLCRLPPRLVRKRPLPPGHAAPPRQGLLFTPKRHRQRPPAKVPGGRSWAGHRATSVSHSPVLRHASNLRSRCTTARACTLVLSRPFGLLALVVVPANKRRKD